MFLLRCLAEGEIGPVVVFPPLPGGVRRFSQSGDVPSDQVVIGSCANGRLEDLRAGSRELLKADKLIHTYAASPSPPRSRCTWTRFVRV